MKCVCNRFPVPSRRKRSHPLNGSLRVFVSLNGTSPPQRESLPIFLQPIVRVCFVITGGLPINGILPPQGKPLNGLLVIPSGISIVPKRVSGSWGHRPAGTPNFFKGGCVMRRENKKISRFIQRCRGKLNDFFQSSSCLVAILSNIPHFPKPG